MSPALLTIAWSTLYPPQRGLAPDDAFAEATANRGTSAFDQPTSTMRAFR
jgi:hypothetical protein